MTKAALREAFRRSIPILCSYAFVGMAYGMMMAEAGQKWYVALLISLAVYTGAFQFVLISGTTAQFGGASGDVFSAICGMKISRFTSSKPSEFSFASDGKSNRRPTTSFVWCCLHFWRAA